MKFSKEEYGGEGCEEGSIGLDDLFSRIADEDNRGTMFFVKLFSGKFSVGIAPGLSVFLPLGSINRKMIVLLSIK